MTLVFRGHIFFSFIGKWCIMKLSLDIYLTVRESENSHKKGIQEVDYNGLSEKISGMA